MENKYRLHLCLSDSAGRRFRRVREAGSRGADQGGAYPQPRAGAGFAAFMKADNADNGKALTSPGLAR
jgi:hypothetical protein